MYIYFFIIILISIIYILIYNTNIIKYHKKKLIFIIIISILLIFFSAIRSDNIGNDLPLYYKIFDSTKNKSIYEIIIGITQSKKILSTAIYNGEYEIGYVLFTKLISFISTSRFSYKFFTSLFINLPVMFFIYKHSKNQYLSILIYILFGFYTQSYVIIRQYMALSITLLSVHYLLKNNYKNAIILSLISCAFHNTAIISLFFILIKVFWNTVLNNLKYIVIGLTLFSFFCKHFVEILISQFYPFYSDMIISGEGLNLFIFLLLILISLLIIMKRNNKTIKDVDFYFILFLLGIILQLYTLHFNLLNRLALYLQFYITITIPNILYLYKSSQRREKRILTLCFISVFISFFTFNLLHNDSGNIRNYQISELNISLNERGNYENNIIY